jgi:uncharacterized protein
MSDYPWVLSSLQVEPLLGARRGGRETAIASLDLGLSSVEVALEARGVVLPDDQLLPWEEVEHIAGSPAVCFAIEECTAVKIQRFSEVRNRINVLLPTAGAPTVLISGVQMHRVRDVDPWEDTELKIRTIAPVTGRVLDTCTGLGYTAIAAARTAAEVVTIELDPAMLEVARLNPWSRPLFESPHIRQIVGDACEEVPALGAGSFGRIVHDPPMFNLAGDLYSGEFYRALYRLLAPRGRLYHYIGDPESRSGRSVTNGALRRLQEAGFSRVVRKPQAFGLLAYK